ncbi:hypothetical protein BpHYR1_042569 [Brachionus plicatilis]|uniref:Uncharacterized protein n=1 Tax=Brachionus plicatilis TaxID=10195 RepID=A0A3M7SB32_BRAPC|nr:hypothetical protein BpHYR1_042569 [Brachionus plicatilis]
MSKFLSLFLMITCSSLGKVTTFVLIVCSWSEELSTIPEFVKKPFNALFLNLNSTETSLNS